MWKRVKILILFIVLGTITSLAQKKSFLGLELGFTGGININSISYASIGQISETLNTRTGFNLGLAMRADLPVRGFSLQPELVYVSKQSVFGEDLDLKMNYIMLPINIQYGLDLILLKPFIEVSPYAGYALSSHIEENSISDGFSQENINDWEYGLGLGGGIDISRFQLKANYKWNFGDLLKKQNEITNNINKSKYGGWEISLAFFL